MDFVPLDGSLGVDAAVGDVVDGRACSSVSSTSTRSAARTAAAGSTRSSRPCWSDRSSRRSGLPGPGSAAATPGAGARGGSRLKPLKLGRPLRTPNPSTPAALPGGSRGGTAPPADSTPDDLGSTLASRPKPPLLHGHRPAEPGPRKAAAPNPGRSCRRGAVLRSSAFTWALMRPVRTPMLTKPPAATPSGIQDRA